MAPRFPPTTEAYLRRTAEGNHGLDPNRLIFTDVAQSKDSYMGFIHCADLALDTLQYNGHTSICDTLWAGVPVLTVPGERMAGRVGASLVCALDCPELVCPTLAVYEHRAAWLATTAGQVEYSALRAKVQANRKTAPLFDTHGWVHNAERLFVAMAERAARGLLPEHIVVDDGPIL